VAGPLRELLGPKPVVVAPMAGGPTGPELVAAAYEADAFGILPAGYRTPAQLEADLGELARRGVERFGVNLFVPSKGCRGAAERARLDAYLERLAGEAKRLSASLGEPTYDDDGWEQKLELLVRQPPPLVSFTFGAPDREVVSTLQAAGSAVVVTITHPEELSRAQGVGADGVCLQGIEAGGHRGGGVDRPERDLPLIQLLRAVRGATELPLLAAGGLTTPQTVRQALAEGAVACQCGTAFLLAEEAGTTPAYRRALRSGRFTETVVTRACTGRSARSLANRFALSGRDAPPCYPEVHNATRPLRQAAAAAGELDLLSLWAGAAFRHAQARPAGEIVELLAAEVG